MESNSSFVHSHSLARSIALLMPMYWKNMCHVIAPSRVLRSLEPLSRAFYLFHSLSVYLNVLVDWGKKWKKVCVLWIDSHCCGQQPPPERSICRIPTHRILTLTLHCSNDANAHFFCPFALENYILFGMQIVWRRAEKNQSNGEIFRLKSVRHTTSSKQQQQQQQQWTQKKGSKNSCSFSSTFSLNC